MTNLQLDTTNESQEVSPFPAGDHKAHINRRTQRHSKHKTEKNIKYHKRSTALERSLKYFTGGLKPVARRQLAPNSEVGAVLFLLRLVGDDALLIGIGIKFHSMGVVNEYDLLNKEERDLGTANAPSTDDRSVRLWVSSTSFSKSVIYWGVKLFMTLYVNTALLYFNLFTVLLLVANLIL